MVPASHLVYSSLLHFLYVDTETLPLDCKFTAEDFGQPDFFRMCQMLLLTIEIVLINFHQSFRLCLSWHSQIN